MQNSNADLIISAIESERLYPILKKKMDSDGDSGRVAGTWMTLVDDWGDALRRFLLSWIWYTGQILSKKWFKTPYFEIHPNEEPIGPRIKMADLHQLRLQKVSLKLLLEIEHFVSQVLFLIFSEKKLGQASK